jgi:23S rRNA (uracil1939-C5)-methyltransferase
MGKKVIVTPSSWMPRGEAKCVGGGQRPLVVWQGIPGETAKVDVLFKGQNQVFGRWMSSDTPSPHRVEPVCDKVGLCGGCPWMHLDADGQAQGHEAMVRDAFAYQGLPEPTFGAYHEAPEPEDFRHVIKVGFARNDRGGLRMGAWGRRTREIIAIPKCNVAAPVLRKVMTSLAHHAIQLDIHPYDPRTERGILRSAVIRASASTGEVLLTLVAAKRTRFLTELAEAVAQGCSEVVGVWLHINSGPGNAIFVRDDQGVVGAVRLAGKEFIEDTLAGTTYRIGPGDFFQTHPAMAEVLYRRTLERLEIGADDTLLDLYAGVGGMAMAAADRAGFVLGVEAIDGAVQRAREAARANRSNAEFMQGLVLEVLPELTTRFGQVGAKVVVDPARRGLEEGVGEAIRSLKPRRLAYVACSVQSLARDLQPFLEAGWTLQPLELFAMFPHTPHVEVLAILDPPEAPAAPRRAPKRKLVR